MTVLLEEPSPKLPTYPPPMKSRLLRSFVRQVSAPSSSQLLLELPSSSEIGTSLSRQHSLPSPRTSASPLSRRSLPNESSHLRHDRDTWRSLAQSQKQELFTTQHTLLSQDLTIRELEKQNSTLQTQHDADITAGKHLSTRLQDMTAKHETLTSHLTDALRTITRLKKSDRSKGKVQQRNLRLKAMLHRYTLSSAYSAAAQERFDAETALREALAMAAERIDELESSGEVLLEALERRDDSCGSESEDGKGDAEMDAEMGLMGAEVRFRSVLDDEMFREQKENWDGLLEQ